MAMIRPQPPRDPSVAPRLPTSLPAGVLVVVALHFGMFSSYSLVMGSLASFVEQDPWAVLRWGVQAFVVCLLLLLCRPLLERFSERRASEAASPVGVWGPYLAGYAFFAFGAAWLRSALAPWALGFALDPREFWQFVAQFFFPLMAALLAIEFYLSRRQARLDWLAVSERLERDLADRRLELVEMDDQLRREAAHHLHGEIQSRLFMAWSLLKLSLGTSDRDTASAQVAQASEQLALLRAQGLRQARDLLGASDSDRPVSQRVAELVERFGAVLPVILDLAPSVSECEGQLDPEGRRQAILLLEEALLNAFQHGRPGRIHVALRVEAAGESTSLILEVVDDGTGFETEPGGKGLGLNALRDELERAGGRFEVESRPRQGTRVTIRLPLMGHMAERHA